MRDYGKVYTAFWTSEDVQSMTEDERTLALYLLTCPHGNMLGCFRLPNAYASDDLKWTPERVSKGFAGLVAKGYIDRCERSHWVLIRRYLKWNQFENPNVGKAAGKLFGAISPPVSLKAALVAALREFTTTFPVTILASFEAENEPIAKPSGTLSISVPKQEPEPEPQPEPEPEPKTKSSEAPLDPVVTIFDYWKKIMDSPRSVLDDKRRKLIARALKSYPPAEVCKAIRGCSKSPHNMGQNDRNTKFNGLGLILRDAEHIDRFIGLDAGAARSGPETMEQKNARVMAEILGEQGTSGEVLEMET
ncbi:MAG: hypothetical protein K2X55_21210 [Burkholderiaceae bacterium]|nr:hypothetical protein [Burkholderiaceae bacterium]